MATRKKTTALPDALRDAIEGMGVSTGGLATARDEAMDRRALARSFRELGRIDMEGADADFDATLLRQGARLAAADLVTRILAQEFPVGTALDAARTAKLLHEIARLEEGRATQITESTTTDVTMEKLERFKTMIAARMYPNPGAGDGQRAITDGVVIEG